MKMAAEAAGMPLCGALLATVQELGLLSRFEEVQPHVRLVRNVTKV